MNYDSIIRLFACFSLIIGAVECFAGYKTMKAMLSIWGFFIGAMIGVAVGVASDNTALGVIFVLVIGTALAILSYKFYLAGIFVLTAFLVAVAFYIIFEKVIASILLGLVAGILSVLFVKPVTLATTAFAGAGIILSSAYTMMDLGINANHVATALLWIPIAAAGVACQYITTQSVKTAKNSAKASGYKASAATYSERRYPGMQRAYRNFCIKCGYELMGTSDSCPRCGFSFDD